MRRILISILFLLLMGGLLWTGCGQETPTVPGVPEAPAPSALSGEPPDSTDSDGLSAHWRLHVEEMRAHKEEFDGRIMAILIRTGLSDEVLEEMRADMEQRRNAYMAKYIAFARARSNGAR